MKKRIVLGDPHGRWIPIIDIYNREQPDEVIILGDYFDSFDIQPYEQKICYNNIIELRNEHIKKKKGNKFIMLIGNHDMHYMCPLFDRCSGWNSLTDSLVGYNLSKDWDKGILKMCYIDEINKTIYSHAGVTQNWFNKWCSGSLGNIETLGIEYFNFTSKDGGDIYGSSSWNSPLWVRPSGLKESPYKDKDGITWSQIFGHTQKDMIDYWNINEGHFYEIDCITKYYISEIIDDTGKLIERIINKR